MITTLTSITQSDVRALRAAALHTADIGTNARGTGVDRIAMAMPFGAAASAWYPMPEVCTTRLGKRPQPGPGGDT